jgi:hypothetical protein
MSRSTGIGLTCSPALKRLSFNVSESLPLEHGRVPREILRDECRLAAFLIAYEQDLDCMHFHIRVAAVSHWN